MLISTISVLSSQRKLDVMAPRSYLSRKVSRTLSRPFRRSGSFNKSSRSNNSRALSSHNRQKKERNRYIKTTKYLTLPALMRDDDSDTSPPLPPIIKLLTTFSPLIRTSNLTPLAKPIVVSLSYYQPNNPSRNAHAQTISVNRRLCFFARTLPFSLRP